MEGVLKKALGNSQGPFVVSREGLSLRASAPFSRSLPAKAVNHVDASIAIAGLVSLCAGGQDCEIAMIRRHTD